MKVLVVSNLYPPDVIGGYEISCEQMVDELRGRGHDVLVLTAANRRSLAADPVHVRRDCDLYGYYDGAGRFTRKVERLHNHATAHMVDPFNTQVFLRALREFEPDVVHLWNLVGLGGLGIVAALHHLGVPWVWHLGDSIPRALCTLDAGVLPPLARASTRFMHGMFTACSEHVLRESEADGPILRRVEIVPNWVEAGVPPARDGWRPNGTLRAVSAGQLAPQKGAALAIEAVARVIEAGDVDITLDVYGTGPGGWIESLIRTRGVSGRVRFLGHRPHPELIDLFAQYDVFIFPTWSREPHAVSQLEAASRGCLCIITNDCGNAEWLVDGVHCVKARRDPASFAAALRDVATRADAEQIARRGQAVVYRDFNIARSADRIESILEAEAKNVVPTQEQFDVAYALARHGSRLVHELIDESAHDVTG